MTVMPIACPFCLQQNAGAALVCAACSRDIAVPASLLAEREELTGKRDAARAELSRARRELEQLSRAKKSRPV